MSTLTLGLYLLFGAISVIVLVIFTTEALKDYHSSCNHNCNQGRDCNCTKDNDHGV